MSVQVGSDWSAVQTVGDADGGQHPKIFVSKGTHGHYLAPGPHPVPAFTPGVDFSGRSCGAVETLDDAISSEVDTSTPGEAYADPWIVGLKIFSVVLAWWAGIEASKGYFGEDSVASPTLKKDEAGGPAFGTILRPDGLAVPEAAQATTVTDWSVKDFWGARARPPLLRLPRRPLEAALVVPPGRERRLRGPLGTPRDERPQQPPRRDEVPGLPGAVPGGGGGPAQRAAERRPHCWASASRRCARLSPIRVSSDICRRFSGEVRHAGSKRPGGRDGLPRGVCPRVAGPGGGRAGWAGTIVDREGKPGGGGCTSGVAKLGYMEPLQEREATADGSVGVQRRGPAGRLVV